MGKYNKMEQKLIIFSNGRNKYRHLLERYAEKKREKTKPLNIIEYYAIANKVLQSYRSENDEFIYNIIPNKGIHSFRKYKGSTLATIIKSNG